MHLISPSSIRPVARTALGPAPTSNETEALLDGLEQIGLAEGRVFDRSLLDKVEQELQRQYYSRGKYSVRIDTTVTPLERNRVGILIDISEGRVARIKQINIVGNHQFRDKELTDDFTLTPPNIFSRYPPLRRE